MSYSATGDPNAERFNTHLGYEADLLTALESMEGVGLSFSRTAIPEWPGIWLKSAEPEYDIIGGGITILDSRTRDAIGTPRVVFTSGHIKFRQSLLVRTEDAERLATHAALTSTVRVGALSGTTGEARLLELTGLADANGVLKAGTSIETPQGTVIADGTADYKITAAETSPNLVGRSHLIPPSETCHRLSISEMNLANRSCWKLSLQAVLMQLPGAKSAIRGCPCFRHGICRHCP